MCCVCVHVCVCVFYVCVCMCMCRCVCACVCVCFCHTCSAFTPSVSQSHRCCCTGSAEPPLLLPLLKRVQEDRGAVCMGGTKSGGRESRGRCCWKAVRASSVASLRECACVCVCVCACACVCTFHARIYLHMLSKREQLILYECVR